MSDKDAKRFSTHEFYENAEDIAKKTESILRLNYPKGTKIEVKVDKHHGVDRSLDEQWDLFKKGKTKSSISLHNLGAAADFNIYINNKYMDGKTYQSQLPYRALGTAANEYGYFWGWDWDSRHIGATRFVHEFFEKYPKEAHRPDVKQWYLKNQEKTKLSYKPLMTYLDSVYQADYKHTPIADRVYTGNEMTRDSLLQPMGPGEDINKKVFGYIYK